MWPLPFRRLAMYYMEHQGPGRICSPDKWTENSKSIFSKDSWTKTIFSPGSAWKGRVSSSYPGVGSAFSVLWYLSTWQWECGRIGHLHSRRRFTRKYLSGPWSSVEYSIWATQSTFLSTSISNLNLLWGSYVEDCVLFTRIGLHIPVVWPLFSVISTSVIRKKDDLMFGTNLSKNRPNVSGWLKKLIVAQTTKNSRSFFLIWVFFFLTVWGGVCVVGGGLFARWLVFSRWGKNCALNFWLIIATNRSVLVMQNLENYDDKIHVDQQMVLIFCNKLSDSFECSAVIFGRHAEERRECSGWSYKMLLNEAVHVELRNKWSPCTGFDEEVSCGLCSGVASVAKRQQVESMEMVPFDKTIPL